MTRPEESRDVEEEPFVPLPYPWPDVPVHILGMVGPCAECFTATTGGDLCRKCDAEYERIANFLRPYIEHDSAALRAERKAREKAEAALLEIAAIRCGVPGHSVAVGCKAASIAQRAIADEKSAS